MRAGTNQTGRGALAALALALLPAATRAGEVDFNRDVLPILSTNCFPCHGPDAGKRKADLRLDIEPNAQKDGAVVIVPGKPGESELIRRVAAQDERDRMPPLKFGRQLSEKQIEILKIWTLQGGKWERHWAFVPPKRSEAPQLKVQPPNPVDAFVRARLQKEGLAPPREADRATLLRRATLDLTGLPPTPEEIAAFQKDDSPDAFAKVVDRLLASPHYGERWGRRWLDVARYADSGGFETDVRAGADACRAEETARRFR